MTTKSSKVKRVRVQLAGKDGNVYAIISRVRRALIDNGQEEEAKKYVEEVTHTQSYDLAIQCTMRYVDVY